MNIEGMFIFSVKVSNNGNSCNCLKHELDR